MEELNDKLLRLNPQAIKQLEEQYLAKIAELETKLNAKSIEIRDLQQENAGLRKLNQNNQFPTKSTSSTSDLEIKLKQSEDRCKELEKELEIVVELKQNLKKSEDKCKELEKDLNAALSQLDSEHSKINNSINNMGNTSKVHLELQTALDQLQTERDNVRVLKYQLENIPKSSDNALLEQRITQLSGAVQQLSQQNRMLIHRLSYSGM